MRTAWLVAALLAACGGSKATPGDSGASDGSVPVSHGDAGPVATACATGIDFGGPPITTVLADPIIPGSRLAVVDVDGDHLADLVSFSPTAAEVRLSTGGGRYADATSFAIGAGSGVGTLQDPFAAADLDGDGRTDFVVATPTDARVVHAVAGGSLELGSTLATAEPVALALGDLDGGALDLVVLHAADVGIRHGNGDGTFGAETIVPVVPTPPEQNSAVFITDVTGDGVADVVVEQGDGVAVLTNTGGGSLAAPTKTPTDSLVTLIAVEDVTGDHRADVVIVQGASVQVLPGTASGALGTPIISPLPAAFPSFQFVLADFDGDGAPDIAARADSGGVMVILHNDGTGHMTALGELPSFGQNFAIATGDVDGDGSPDIVTTTAGLAATLVNPARDAAVAALAPSLNTTRTFHATGAASADLDHDGHLDLVAFRRDSLFVARTGDARGITVGDPLQIPAIVGANEPAQTPILAAVDGDANPDVLLLVDGTLRAMLGGGDGTFAAPIETTVPAFGVMAVGYLDADASADVVIADQAGHATVLIGRGDGHFDTAATVAAPSVASGVAIADLDGDGVPDLVIAGQDVVVALGTGGGSFAAPTTIGSADLGSVSVADVDGDGKLDVTVGNRYFAGHGDGTFDGGHDAAVPGAASLVDVDGDGVPDAIAADSFLGVASVARGSVTGGVWSTGAPDSYVLGLSREPPTVVDIDGDGHPDLVTRDGNSGQLLLLYGSCRP